MKTLLVGGFMGAGKSTVGPIVASRAGVPFVDLDDAIARRAGSSVGALFAERGEHAFRALEAAELDGLLADPAAKVIALGGGALLDATRRRAVLERAFVVTLTASARTIAARTIGGGRPLLDSAASRDERVRELLEARAATYAEAHARIPTDERTAEAVAAAVAAAWSTPTIAVPLGERSYAVTFPSDACSAAADAVVALAPSSVLVVTDENVAKIWGQPLDEALARSGVAPIAKIVLPPGEAHKTLATVERTLATMVGAGADRSSVVLAFGGGVVSDLAGFCAATLLRGVRWVGVPTTLLAMVDASVGGKTGVDLGSAKNAVGAFHQPRSVVVGARFTSTLVERDFRSGFAEIVKTACIGDAALLEVVERRADALGARDEDAVREAALGSVAVKARIVSRDEREAGDRVLLNFGHTLGHALEAHGGYARLTHGEAVSLGMVAMLRVGVELGVTPAAAAAHVTALLARLGLPVDVAAQPVAEALELLGLDKKRTGGSVRAVFMGEVGAGLVREMPLAELRAHLRT